MDKSLDWLINTEKDKTQIVNIKNKRETITLALTDIKIIKGHYEQYSINLIM